MNLSFKKTLIIGIIGYIQLFAQKPASIQYISPIHNSELNTRSSEIIIRPGEMLDPATIYETTLFEVIGSESSAITGNIILSTDNKTVIFKPTNPFAPDETVTVKLNPGLKTQKGEFIPPFSF